MIDKDRIQHIFAVAKLMKDKAKNVGLDEEEMFTLGLLHDVGYEFGEIETHNNKGGDILEKQNYKYYNEVKYHGIPKAPFSSTALDLLNYADMHIDKYGNYVTFEERLQDIASRRGVDSPFYKNSKQIADYLISINFLK